jgi:WD40 repeat protein
VNEFVSFFQRTNQSWRARTAHPNTVYERAINSGYPRIRKEAESLLSTWSPRASWVEMEPKPVYSLLLQNFRGHSQSVTGVAFSHDESRILSASGDGSVRVWDFYTGSCLHTLSGHLDAVVRLLAILFRVCTDSFSVFFLNVLTRRTSTCVDVGRVLRRPAGLRRPRRPHTALGSGHGRVRCGSGRRARGRCLCPGSHVHVHCLRGC